MERRAEDGAVEREHARLLHYEGDGLRLARVDVGVHVVPADSEPVAHPEPLFGVRDVEADGVAHLELEVVGSVEAADGHHPDVHLLAVPLDERVVLCPHLVGMLVRVPAVEAHRIEEIGPDHLREVGLLVGERLEGHHHRLSADVDELAGLGNLRTRRDVPSRRLLVHGNEPVAVRFPGVASADDQVPGIRVDVDPVHDDLLEIRLFLVGPRRQPELGHARVDEQRRVAVPPAVELGVQRSLAHGHEPLGDRVMPDDRHAPFLALEVFVLHRLEERLEVEHRGGRLELSAAHDPPPGRIDVDPVGRLRQRHVVHDALDLARVDHRHPVDLLVLALLDRLLGAPPVDPAGVVPLELAGLDLEPLVGHLRVVGGHEEPARTRALAGRGEVPLEGRSQDLPGDLHLTRLGIDGDRGDHAVVLVGKPLDGRRGPPRKRHRESRPPEQVLGVLGHERRPVVARRVRDRPQDLLRLEVLERDPGDAVVGVVVHEEPPAVVLSVRLRERGVVDIAPRELSQHLARLVIEAVAVRGVRREDGNRLDVAHRGDPCHAHVRSVAARIEEVVLVHLTRRDVRALGGGPPLGGGFSAGGGEQRERNPDRESRKDAECVHGAVLPRCGFSLMIIVPRPASGRSSA